MRLAYTLMNSRLITSIDTDTHTHTHTHTQCLYKHMYIHVYVQYILSPILRCMCYVIISRPYTST